MTDLNELIEASGQNAEDKGFHDTGNLLRQIIEAVGKHGSVLSTEQGFIDIPNKFWDELYAAYKGNRLMLIVGEIVEAHEEVRSGKPSIYEKDGKPEGTAVELGDAEIRLADYAWEFNEPVVEAIETKAAYNKTREKMHGGRKF